MILPDRRIIRPNAGHILLARRFVDVGMPTAQATMAGRYKLIVRDAWGGARRETDWFDNIILDSGLNRMGTGTAIAGAAIGTGSSAPVATQTALDSQTTYTTSQQSSSASALGSSPYNNTYTVTYRTTLGALNGNYSEVGVGWASGSMFSRALILDGGGSPTTISVASTEQLDIVYQLSIYPPTSDTSNTVTISGTSYTVTGRGANVNSSSAGFGGWSPATAATAVVGVQNIASWNNHYTGAIGAITSSPSGTIGSTGSSAVVGSYSNNSLTRAGRASYGLSEGNLSGGIKSTFFAWSFCAFQYGFSPNIPKDGTKTLTLDYSVSWARRP